MSRISQADQARISRALVPAYSQMLALLEQMRSEATDLDELIAIATVTDQVSASRRYHSNRLRNYDDAAWAQRNSDGTEASREAT